MQIKGLISNIPAKSIARIYSIGSILISLSGVTLLIDRTIEPWKQSLHIPALYAFTGSVFLFWIVFSIYALFCFSRAKISIRAPLIFLIYLTFCEYWNAAEILWDAPLKSWLSTAHAYILVPIWLFKSGLHLAFMAFFILTNYQLFKQANKNRTENEISSSPTNYAYAGFWRRACATLIDALVLGITAAFILPITAAISVKTYALVEGRQIHNLIQSMPGFALIGFITSFPNSITGSTCFFIFFPGWLALGSPIPSSSNFTTQFALCFMFANTCIAWLYYAFMESSAKQATVGKLIMGIKMTRLDGERVSFSRALLRYLAKIISLATFLLGYLVVPFNQKKQTIHDLISGCVAVQTPKGKH